MDPRVKAVLFVIGILLPLASGSWLWTLVHQYNLLGTNSQSSPEDPADLPLFSGCEEMACQVYMGALESTVNRTQDPCKDLYRFVCDGWQHRYHLSVVGTTEEAVYSRALSAILRPRLGESNEQFISSDAWGAEQKVIAFARSCMHFAESSLADVKKFMADRHLPWPNASRWDLLEVLLDLSGNWNVHLWFQVTFEMAPFRGGSAEPALRISHSAAFRTWIATMRSFAGRPVSSTSARRYRRYVKDMLGFFDVSESRAEELAPKIEEMDRLTLGVLGPAMSENDSRALRLAIRNLSYTATPGIAAGRLLLLFNEYFIWARRFSARDVVEVTNPGLLRSVVYLLGLKSETREALTLSLGLRLAHELGWMAHRGIADVTLDLVGLPPSAHYLRCLSQVESAVGVGWASLFPEKPGVDTLVEDVRLVLADTVERQVKSPFRLQARAASAQWNHVSPLAIALPQPTPGERFFIDWMNLMNARWWLQEQDLSNILKPGSVLNHRWSFHGTLTVAEDYFVFPLYHPDFPPAVNYGGAGRLIADEVLRGLVYEPRYKHQHGRQHSHERRSEYQPLSNDSGSGESSQDFQQHNVDTKALLAALGAYRLRVLRNWTDSKDKEWSMAHDRLFFVASCYALCSSSNSVDMLYGDASSRCNVPIRGLPEFQAAFHCVEPRAHD
ncbi:endothelin-converting enzyme-like 1 [Haemaphysalis longicornis]